MFVQIILILFMLVLIWKIASHLIDEWRSLDFNGELRSTVNISDTYSEFRRSEDYIFLMGYDHIDRIDYNS